MPDLPETLPADLHEFEVLAGRWDDGATSEWWVPAGDVWWSISLGPGEHFDIARVEALDGQVRFVAQPEGREPVPFALVGDAAGDWRFTNSAHDEPKSIHYRLRGKRLLAAIGNEQERVVLRGRSSPTLAVPALEDADRVFLDDVAARGVDAWIDMFDPAGYQWDTAAGRLIPPGDLMRAYMADTLAGRLVWDPVASGLSPGGTVGFTVGTWTWTPPEGTTPVGHGSYITIWRRQADGTWKVLYDGGDPAT